MISRSASIALAALLLVSGSASAQSTPVLAFPPSLVSSNTERSFPGLWEPLEAGAVLVRDTDPSAVWYNPAGIVSEDRSGLSANAPGYQFTFYGGNSDNRPAEGNSLRGLPSFIGAVLGREVVPWRNVRFGFGLSNPISAQQGVQVEQQSIAGNRSEYAVSSDLESFQGSGAVAWAPLENLRLGLSIGMSYDTISSSAQTNAEATSTAIYTGSLDSSTISANTQQFVSSIGAQWNPVPWIGLGMVIRPPAVKVLGSSTIHYDGILDTSSGEQQVHYEGNGSFEFRQPLQINLGASAHLGHGNIEANFFWHQASGGYTLFGVDQQPQRLVNTPGPAGTPMVLAVPFPDIRTHSRAILNISVGGNYQLDRIWWIHGGAYVDQSPTDLNDPFFQPVDFYALRAGVSLRQPTGLSGSLGLGYELGVSQRAPGAGSPLYSAQPPVSGNLNINTVSLLLAIGYRF